ncbi:MAG: cytochrome c1 [Pseudomonadota bacterium]|nr:cytochrome c1 [Caulobacteraceae bacterium]MDX5393378.1 cytochrome c1 [Caulobacteraceae bacterium]
MLRKSIALAALGLALVAGPALAAGNAKHPRDVDFSFEGPFGRFDQGQLQRGYKVYREVCAACHGMNLVSFRNLGQKGGPFYDPDYPNPNDNPYVRTIAAEYQISDIDSETGDVIQRPGTSADRFPNPYPNEAAARAGNGGALPPDLSVIVKARHYGAEYIYSLLSGYVDPPEGLQVSPGQYYNPYMPGDLHAFWTGEGHAPKGGFIAMPPQLAPDKVTFDDGTPSTIEQQAKDVAAFLAWASEPKMEERKAFGMGAMIYLVIFAGLLYASYRRIWRNVAH